MAVPNLKPPKEAEVAAGATEPPGEKGGGVTGSDAPKGKDKAAERGGLERLDVEEEESRSMAYEEGRAGPQPLMRRGEASCHEARSADFAATSAVGGLGRAVEDEVVSDDGCSLARRIQGVGARAESSPPVHICPKNVSAQDTMTNQSEQNSYKLGRRRRAGVEKGERSTGSGLGRRLGELEGREEPDRRDGGRERQAVDREGLQGGRRQGERRLSGRVWSVHGKRAREVERSERGQRKGRGVEARNDRIRILKLERRGSGTKRGGQRLGGGRGLVGGGTAEVSG